MSFEEIFNFEVLRRVITNTVYLTLKYFFYVFFYLLTLTLFCSGTRLCRTHGS